MLRSFISVFVLVLALVGSTWANCEWDGESYGTGDQVDCYEGKKHCRYQHCLCSPSGEWYKCWNDDWCEWNDEWYRPGYQCYGWKSEYGCYDDYNYCRCWDGHWQCSYWCEWNDKYYKPNAYCVNCNDYSRCYCNGKTGNWWKCM